MIRRWILKIDGAPGQFILGNRDAIMDMAYDNGAMCVTLIPEKV